MVEKVALNDRHVQREESFDRIEDENTARVRSPCDESSRGYRLVIFRGALQ
jgi:hypothetical protein